MPYLLKTEPTVYSFADLQRDKSTLWDGVTAPAAVKHLREMSVDPSDPKNPAVTIKAGKPLPAPVTLAQIKSNKLFATSPLVRQGRLSVVPLTEAQYKALL